MSGFHRILVASILMSCLMTAAAAQTQPSDDVSITVRQFGLGQVARPGEVNGIELELISNLTEDATLWAQWDHETVDGDIVAFGRRITLSPGQPRGLWLYVPLAPSATLESVSTIRVRTLEDGTPAAEIAGLRFEAGTVNPRFLDRTQGIIGVVGRQPSGLGQLARSPEFMMNQTIAAESSAIGLIPNPQRLPDQWLGLRPFESLIWTDAAVELSPAQEDAMLEWLRRGGHLVVILPPSGNPWSLGMGADGPLGSIMPDEPLLAESVAIADVLPKLTKHPQAVSATGTVSAHVFRNGDFQAAPADAGWRDIWSIDGVGTLGVQRNIGLGRLSVIGVDIADRTLRDAALARPGNEPISAEPFPEADVFWNPLLGRRADTPSAEAVQQVSRMDRAVGVSPSTRHINDALIMAHTDDASGVGTGLLVAFVLFLSYWLVAVPVCWATLKRIKQLHWSWVGFFATSLVFTAIAWGLVAGMRVSQVRIRHLTVIDHVHGEDLQRAVSWMSIFTPGYGDYELELEGTDGDFIMPWEPATLRIGGFPDTRQTMVDLGDRGGRLTIPSRATTTSVQVDWRGPIAASQFGDILRMDPSSPINVRRTATGTPIAISGAIVSNLPAALQDVQIFFIDRPQNKNRQPDVSQGLDQPWTRPSESGRLESVGYAWGLGSSLEPGDRIVLNNLVIAPDPFDLERALKVRFSDSLVTSIGTPLRPMTARERRRALEGLSFFHQLEPPHWLRETASKRDNDWAVTRRLVGRELDLSEWLTQPSIIVTGFLNRASLPLPLSVEGRPVVDSTGLVMMRWIMPLPETPPGGSQRP